MAEKKNKNADSIKFIDKDAEVIFTDVVQINATQETVCIQLGLRNKKNKSANVTHDVYMTLPHFVRFSNACQNLSNELVKKFEESNDADID